MSDPLEAAMAASGIVPEEENAQESLPEVLYMEIVLGLKRPFRFIWKFANKISPKSVAKLRENPAIQKQRLPSSSFLGPVLKASDRRYSF